MKEGLRQSNFELMRIISMLMIIFWHILYHANIIDNANASLSIILMFVRSFIYIHVNIFILTSGYFMSNTKFKMSKLLQLNNTIWFYRALIPLILILLGFISMDSISLIRLLIPFHTEGYWFMKAYLYLYMLSPFLNIIINNISKKDYKKMLIIFFVIFSIMPFFTNQTIYDTNDGFGLLQFIILYFIGAYFRKFKIEESYYFKNFSLNAKRLILFGLYSSLAVILGFIYIATSFNSYGKVVDVVFNIISSSIMAYNNPFIMIESVLFFLFFSLLNIKSKFINIVSSTTLGVYLIHDNKFLRTILFEGLGFTQDIYSVSILLKVFACTFLIFIGCSLIEFIRQKIFKFIYNRKISQKFRKSYRSFIDSLGVKINW